MKFSARHTAAFGVAKGLSRNPTDGSWGGAELLQVLQQGQEEGAHGNKASMVVLVYVEIRVLISVLDK